MDPIKNALAALTDYKNALVAQMEQGIQAESHAAVAGSRFRAAVNGYASPYDHDLGRSYVKRLEGTRSVIERALNQLVTFCAKVAANDADYAPDIGGWILKHAPLWVASDDHSELVAITSCRSSIDAKSFEKGVELIKAHDFSYLHDALIESFSPDNAFAERCREAAKAIIYAFSLSRVSLSDIARETRRGVVLTDAIWSEATSSWKSTDKSREWRGGTETCHKLSLAFEVLSRWADDDTAYDISCVYRKLRGDIANYVYFDSREKFTADAATITMFNGKYELLMPRSTLGSMVAFLRTFAADELFDARQAA